MGPLVFGIVIVVVIFGLLTYRERRKQLCIQAERSGYTAADFASFFEQKGIPISFSTSVYEYLQGLLGVKGVPIKPSDKLDDVLGIGTTGGVLLDEVIEEVLCPLGVKIPPRETIDFFAEKNGWSGKVDDLVRLLFFLFNDSSGSTD